MTLLAITREVSPALERCELTHLARRPIDVDRARRQHAAYCALLAELGCEVQRLPAEPDLPDSVFVEDAAVVLDEVAIVARPGAASRRAETTSVAAALAPHRELLYIEAPATLDGGDVLCLARDVFVGLSSRSGEPALAQMRTLLEPRGLRVHGVPLDGCLHLKSAACAVGVGTLLVQPRWVDPRAFAGYECIAVDESEPFAANAVRVRDALIHPEAFPRTRERLEERGVRVLPVAADELAKAEGGVSCCSLLVER